MEPACTPSIIEVIKSLGPWAWPIMTFTIVLIFRRTLKELLEKIRTITIGRHINIKQSEEQDTNLDDSEG